MDACILRGVRTHNLKGIDVSIPFGRLTVVTGVSGSGKSSLVFDTVYAEGQRRFVDCLATYARQFLERLERPDADSIGHIEPPLALKQTVAVRNARSTVGSMSEVADYLQLLFAHAGEAHCVQCGAPLEPETVETAVQRILGRPPEDRLCLAAPVVRDRLGKEGIRGLLQQGYVRTVHEGIVREWPDEWLAAPASELPSPIEVVVDRFPRRNARRGRIAEAVQGAWHLGQGRALLYALPGEAPSGGAGAEVDRPDAAGGEAGSGAGAGREVPAGRTALLEEIREGTFCRSCGTPGETPHPGLFSSNSPLGACPECEGFGRIVTVDRDKVIPDPRRTLRNDAVVPFRMPSGRKHYRRMMKLAAENDVRTETPWRELAEREQEWVFRGSKGFRGVEGFFQRLERKRYRMHVRIFLARFRGYVPCPACNATRLKKAALSVTIAGKNLAELNALPIAALRALFDSLELPPAREARVRAVLREIRSRLRCLDEVGLGYLGLDRPARTLSGGETQRLRLASGMGASLTRTLYVLDEPTVGLHARDAARVLGVLKRICRMGNTALVVEHDPAVVEGADHLIVLGPEGGERGGELLFEGTPQDFLAREPGFFRTGARPAPPRAPAGGRLRLRDVRAHNLKIADLSVPLGGIVAVSGVSGSGKSTLLDEVIHRNWRRHRGLAVEDVGAAGRIDGYEDLEDVLLIAQEPLGRSTRSNALSFVGALSVLRDLLAKTPQARAAKLTARDFSFNVPGGRCEICKGLGTVILEMHFLPDVEVTCEACKGRRFREDVLEVSFRGRNIQSLLEMSGDQATLEFGDVKGIVERLRPLREVGLGYLRLGQPTSTLSGGEAQRLKLASFLAEGKRSGRRLFLFDEPTTGLHARDVERLLTALRALIARGDAILVVEHHLDFLAAADWIIDLGPGAGAEGGRVVYEGPAAGILDCRASLTGRALAAHLASSPRPRPRREASSLRAAPSP